MTPFSMRRALPTAALVLSLVPLAMMGDAGGSAVRPKAVVDRKYEVLFKEHCLSCHNEEKRKGSVRLDNLPFEIESVETAERWQKVLNALNSAEMPPEEEKQPDKGVKTDFLEHLAQQMVVARRSIADTGGRITLRRLNQREYKNTLRELLGVDVGVGDLPADGSGTAFDTVGSNLFMSGSQFDSYRQIGRKALDAAFGLYVESAPPRKLRIEPEDRVNPQVESEMARQSSIRKRVAMWTRAVDAAAARPENARRVAEIRATQTHAPNQIYHAWEKIPGAPPPSGFGFVDAVDVFHHQAQWNNLIPSIVDYLSLPKVRSGMYLSRGLAAIRGFTCFVPGDWPDGEYRLRIRIASVGALSLMPSRNEFKPTPAPEPAENRRFLDITLGDSEKVLSTHQITGTMETPQEVVLSVTVEKGGTRHFKLRETNPEGGAGDRDQNPALWLDWIEFDGPLNPSRPTPAALTVLGVSHPDSVATEENVRRGLEDFCRLAFRGKAPSKAYVEKLYAAYQARRQTGEKPAVAIRTPLSIILASPHFLYLSEPVAEAQSRALTGLELASRLSYFLWGGPPDAELLEKARNGELQKPAVLSAEVERLLAHEKSRDWVTGFTRQWLGMDRLDFFMFNQKRFPAFSAAVKEAAREEVYATVQRLVRENLSLKRLLLSDEVVVNGLLANYYQIQGVSGDAFRPVKVPADSPRGGLLGMAAVLAMGSNGEQTSPVERGAWVLRKMLFTPPPPAPPNVPQLTRLEGRLLTTRERLVAHQEEPQCASCHRKIDPIGFGLENFDAAGQWRTEDGYEKAGVGNKRWRIEPAGAFHNGPAFRDYFELRALIAGRADQFARGFTEALLEYGLGRPCGFSDQELVQQIVERAKNKDFAVRTFFQELVHSRAFQTK
jgi:mono/diheme cytochrome c family protein